MESGFKLDEEGVEKRIGELSDEFAQRLGALADLFSRWREPEVARSVIEALISGDGEAFRELGDIDLPNIPPLGICAWIVEVLEKVVPVPRTEEVCRLRDPLSPWERRLYLAIVFEFMQTGQSIPIDASGVIQPGPFLEALKAANLVNCVPEWAGGGLELVIGKPERICV